MNVYSYLHGELDKCTFSNAIFSCSVNVFQTIIEDTRADTNILLHLALLPKDSLFVKSYLGVTVRTILHSKVSFKVKAVPVVNTKMDIRQPPNLSITLSDDLTTKCKYL
jgi:hypothetical protein